MWTHWHSFYLVPQTVFSLSLELLHQDLYLQTLKRTCMQFESHQGLNMRYISSQTSLELQFKILLHPGAFFHENSQLCNFMYLPNSIRWTDCRTVTYIQTKKKRPKQSSIWPKLLWIISENLLFIRAYLKIRQIILFYVM